MSVIRLKRSERFTETMPRQSSSLSKQLTTVAGVSFLSQRRLKAAEMSMKNSHYRNRLKKERKFLIRGDKPMRRLPRGRWNFTNTPSSMMFLTVSQTKIIVQRRSERFESTRIVQDHGTLNHLYGLGSVNHRKGKQSELILHSRRNTRPQRPPPGQLLPERCPSFLEDSGPKVMLSSRKPPRKLR